MSIHSSVGARESHLKPGEFYGAVVGSYERAGVVLAELSHHDARRLPRHTHESAYFCLLLEGAYSEQVGRRTFDYKPYTAVFHPPGLSHIDSVGVGGGRFFTAAVDGEWLERLRECGAWEPDVYADERGGELVWLSSRLYCEYRRQDALSPLSIEGLLLEMLALTARTRTPAERRPLRWLARAIEMLHENFLESLTIGEVANTVGVHPYHLSKVFRQVKGETVGDYVRRLRAQHACRLLAGDSALTLAEVALACGFADQSHFTRNFRRVTGLTPGDFRRTQGMRNVSA